MSTGAKGHHSALVVDDNTQGATIGHRWTGASLDAWARDAGVSTLRLMAWSTSMTAVALLPVALLSPQPSLPQSPAGWAILAALALVSQVLGQGLIAFGFVHLSASLSSVSLLLQPVLATLLAWALFSETIGPSQLIGGGVVLGGIWLARRGS